MKPVVNRAATLALFAVSALCTLLSACASRPPPAPSPQLLHDELFTLPMPAPDGQDVFAMSEAMRAYAERELTPLARHHDPRRELIDALYRKGRLQLDYDASVTRSAAESFASRAGNCLSLVIMTASFARHLGLPVSFQAVQIDDFYTRNGGLYFASGHVNLVLGPPAGRSTFNRSDRENLTVDFLPQDELRGQRTRPLEEQTIVAMFLNNRAAEALAAGRIAQAYGYARAALLHDPGFYSASNTLGVVYNHAGHSAPAEAAFRHALAGDADNLSALSNLVKLLQRQGHGAESALLAARLDRLQPVPPFHHFNLGRAAMDVGDYALARDHFLRELRMQPYQDEVHFWAAQAYWQLGQASQARRHLSQAVENSANRDTHDRYVAKLEGLRQGAIQ